VHNLITAAASRSRSSSSSHSRTSPRSWAVSCSRCSWRLLTRQTGPAVAAGQVADPVAGPQHVAGSCRALLLSSALYRQQQLILKQQKWPPQQVQGKQQQQHV
jgi:hypothetical protein